MSANTMGKILANPTVRHFLYQPKDINNDYDIPFIGSYSKDGKTIYFDRHLPEVIFLKLDGQKREVNPRELIKPHEELEKAIISALGWGYYLAHAAATAYEKRGVLQRLGPQWWMPYTHAMDGYAKADEHEKIRLVPKDLDMTPYHAAPANQLLLKAMKKAMGK